MPQIAWLSYPAFTTSIWPAFLHALLLLTLVTRVHGMTAETISELRQDTKNLFYHGFDNYLTHAFPEDELKPITCKPQTRNRENPADIGLNDVLGNYSLTLIDSLSTLALLASGEDKKDKKNPLRDFQNGVKSLVGLYGDGTDRKPCGSRACGFDLDSKVQVFETNIRGVGGLLSAHLFAMGELPIKGYDPVWKPGKSEGIKWKNGFTYNGQLLYLALDLAERLLPAFSTETDLPYPRVNLRYGIPFYQNSEEGVCNIDGSHSGPRELTENCAAGAGSLILEFTTLSRLTGDMRFERVAKRAFWAIWDRRSSIDLIGNGIDSESGQWTSPPLAGIGAGIDSFFEYSLKSHILLSNLPYDPEDHEIDSPDGFLEVWRRAHLAVKRHVYRNSKTEKHPYYAQVDLTTGASRYSWIDNLSAYYPGLLVLAGELEEAVESHLLYAALWTRYSALPERWQVANGFIDSNFRHWAGRPEFIESTFHLFQATKDPYYLHVGEMTLRDIRRRCWTKCGWADLGDVTTGEQRDRMESFFLGETAKYLYLLFTEDHPLNKLDKPVVFTTEGHPLLIPDTFRRLPFDLDHREEIRRLERRKPVTAAICPAAPKALPFTVSNVANRPDLFHAAALTQLHLVPVQPSRPSPLMAVSPNGPAISLADVRSPTNYTFYPWTLPTTLIPTNGISSPIIQPLVSTLTFPNLSGVNLPGSDLGIVPMGALQKMVDGIIINSLSNLRLNMIQEAKSDYFLDNRGLLVERFSTASEYRIHGIANWALGRDEKVVLTNEALKGVSPSDPNFTRMKDLEMIDLIIDVPIPPDPNDNHNHPATSAEPEVDAPENDTIDALWTELQVLFSGLLQAQGSAPPSERHGSSSSSSLSPQQQQQQQQQQATPSLRRQLIPAILPTGLGAAPLPALMDADHVPLPLGRLPWTRTYFLDSQLCGADARLPASVARGHNILFIRRGGCSFNEKLANIPSFPPSPDALQLVVVISSVSEAGAGRQGEGEGGGEAGGGGEGHGEEWGTWKRVAGEAGKGLIRPLLDLPQLTPNGFERRNPIALVMVEGSEATVAALRAVAKVEGRFDEAGRLVEVAGGGAGEGSGGRVVEGTGLSIKRRYWFESMGVPIGNLLML